MNNDLHNAYRPQNFSEMYGQEALVNSLISLEKEVEKGLKEWPHAYLLVGSAGTGKTTTGRILASKVNCSPANITEVDSATYTSVDSIRSLTSTMSYKAFGSSPNKVYILDEAHRLSRQAFDALLKSLEEPPPHVYFILCTTERDKIPKTIASRCVEYIFKPLKHTDTVMLLEDVCESEQIKLPEGVLDLVARKSEGSPRTALTMLAKVSNAANKKDAMSLLESIENEDGVIELCRMMVSGKGFTWENVVPILRSMADENPESVRMIVINYVSKALLGANSERSAVPLLAILEKFGRPFNQSEKLVPVMLAVGELLFGEE